MHIVIRRIPVDIGGAVIVQITPLAFTSIILIHSIWLHKFRHGNDLIADIRSIARKRLGSVCVTVICMK